MSPSRTVLCLMERYTKTRVQIACRSTTSTTRFPSLSKRFKSRLLRFALADPSRRPMVQPSQLQLRLQLQLQLLHVPAKPRVRALAPLGNRDQLHDATSFSKAHPRLVYHHAVLAAAVRTLRLYTLTTIGRLIHRRTRLSQIDVKRSSSTRFRTKRGG